MSTILVQKENQDFPTRCSSPPVENAKVEDMPTPRANRRSSPCSVSPPSSPGDEMDVQKLHLPLQRRSRHSHSNHRQVLPVPPEHRSESRCSQCSHCSKRGYYDSIPRYRHEHIHPDPDNDSEDNFECEEYYGTMPTRRVSKNSRGMRHPPRSVKNYRHNRPLSPDNPEDDEDNFDDETASDIYWSTHAGSVNDIKLVL